MHHACIRACKHIHPHTCNHACIHAYVRTHIHACIHTHTCMHANTDTHTQRHTQVHKYTRRFSAETLGSEEDLLEPPAPDPTEASAPESITRARASVAASRLSSRERPLAPDPTEASTSSAGAEPLTPTATCAPAPETTKSRASDAPAPGSEPLTPTATSAGVGRGRETEKTRQAPAMAVAGESTPRVPGMSSASGQASRRGGQGSSGFRYTQAPAANPGGRGKRGKQRRVYVQDWRGGADDGVCCREWVLLSCCLVLCCACRAPVTHAQPHSRPHSRAPPHGCALAMLTPTLARTHRARLVPTGGRWAASGPAKGFP